MSQTIKISAEKSGVGDVTVEYTLGDSVEELIEQFGEEVIYSRARQSLIIAIQSFLRNQVEQGKSAEEIQENVNDWKPGVRRPAKTPEDRAREAFAAMTPEQRAAVLADLRSGK